MKKENNNANKRPVSMTDFGAPKTGLKNTKKAFTLVELIIVITILAILATIAFVSFQGYTKNARDGNRIATLSNIEKGLELLVIKTGTYPMPEGEYSTGSINDGTTDVIYAYKGTIQDNISRLINISKTPIDPLSDDYYVYATTSNKREYQIATTLETLQAYNPLITQTHADAGNTAKVNGNYKERMIFSSGGTTYYTNIPSLILSNTGSVNLLEKTGDTAPRYIIDKGTNIVYNPNGKPLTTEEITKQKTVNDIVKEKTKKEDAELVVVSKTELQAFVEDPNTLPAGITSSGVLLSSFNVDTVENLDFVVLGNTSVTTSSSVATTTTTTYSCTGTVPTSNVSKTNDTGLTADAVWQNTINTDPCYYECTNSYTGNDCSIAPLTGWRLLDSNCTINDITIGTQTWAGCNSTLGTGFEWGKQDNGTNGTIGSCYNYDGTNNASDADCAIGNANMASNISAKNFFDLKQPDGTNTNGDSEYANIWGKYYTWANSPSACPVGRHIPSDTEWSTLEQFLGCSSGEATRTTWGCDGLGWKLHDDISKDDTNNLADALKLPLAGYRLTDGSTFSNRGNGTYLWSSTPSSTNAYLRLLNWFISAVFRNSNSQDLGFSVRCIKD